MTKPLPPARVSHVESYWGTRPHDPSPRLLYWMERIRGGWRPNRRISKMGYTDSARFFGVYVWEYLNVISPALHGHQPHHANAYETKAWLEGWHPVTDWSEGSPDYERLLRAMNTIGEMTS